MKLTPCPYCGTEPETLLYLGIVHCVNAVHCPVMPSVVRETFIEAEAVWNERMAALDRIEKLEAMMKWQPIETAPKDGTPVLVWAQYADVPVVARFQGNRWQSDKSHIYVDGNATLEDDWERHHFYTPTNWMPLPPNP